MRWTPGGDSQDIEDRRDEGDSGGGGGFGLPFGGMHIGIGGIVFLVILSLLFKRNFFSMFGGGGIPAGPRTSLSQPDRAKDQREQRRGRPPALSTVLRMKRSTSISIFTTNCRDASARPDSSRKPTFSLTRSGT